MNYPTHALLISALAIGGFAGGARAASLAYQDHLGFTSYAATTDNTQFADDIGLDLSNPPAEVYLFGANGYEATVQGGTLAHSYAADAWLGFGAAGADLSMNLSHSLDLAGAGGSFAASHRQDVGVELLGVTLRIEGGAGEAEGTPVTVQFAGLASALYDFGAGVQDTDLQLGLSLWSGDTQLGGYDWSVAASGEQAVSFSFTGYVGQSLTMIGFMRSGLSLDGSSLAAGNAANIVGSLGGSFSVTPVPEPQTYAMLVAGLGLLAGMARRARRNGDSSSQRS